MVFPEEGFRGGGETICINLLLHFGHFHVQDTIVILDEGNRPHPHFPYCEIFVPLAALNRHYPTTALVLRVLEQRLLWMGDYKAW